MSSKNLSGIYVIIWICAVLYVIGAPEVPYILYFFIGSPVLVLGGIILYYIRFEPKKIKKEEEKRLKEKRDRELKIELSRQKVWDNLPQAEKNKILEEKKRKEIEEQDKRSEELLQRIKYQINAEKLAKEKSLRDIKIKEENENEFLRTLTTNKNFIENSLVDSFSKKQKLSAITLMRAILGGTQDANKAKLQERAIIKQGSLLGVSVTECDNFANNLNLETLKSELRSLSNVQKDFIVGMSMEVLHTGGTPSEREVIIAENAFEKLANMNIDELSRRVEKIKAIGNYFSK